MARDFRCRGSTLRRIRCPSWSPLQSTPVLETFWRRDRSPRSATHEPSAQPKDLMIIKNANHVDLYDRMDRIPFDKMSEFFGRNLK